jgi:hypothetical protein
MSRRLRLAAFLAAVPALAVAAAWFESPSDALAAPAPRVRVEILALVQRVSELRAQYKAAGYTVTRWGAEHPKWKQ